MHGVIFAELKKYVGQKLGEAAWDALLKEAHLEGKIYLANQEYPDQDVVAMVTAASKITSLPAGTILEDFGKFIAPDLIRMFRMSIKPEWRTLDLIEHTEETIHKVVRLRDPGSKPPKLVCQRTAPEEVVIKYSSERKLCAVAKGIARGLAEHYGEQVSISESTCMLNGSPACTISVRLKK